MDSKIKINSNEIIERLVRLQSDVNVIKERLESVEDNALKSELKMWEETSVEDNAMFFEKHKL